MTARRVTGPDVKVARLNAGLSLRELAQELGVGHTQIKAFEDGKRIVPKTGKAIADWMGCEVVDLEQFARELEEAGR